MKQFLLALSVAAGLVISAQDGSVFQHVCLSPPLPPTFRAVQEDEAYAGRASSYAVPFDTIRYNYTLKENALDVVICLDGVINNAQIDACDRYVDSLVARLQTIAHYNPRFKYFNIYRIAKLSNEAGAAWGFLGDTTIDNRYGSRFNAFNLPRLLVPEKYDTLFADIEQFVPHYDLAIMLVNDKKYGGAGWTLFDGRKVATFSLDEESGWHLGDEVAIHELQHIMPFAGHGYLGDEYEDSTACLIYDSIPSAPNFTADTVNQRKWEHCAAINGVGFYPNAGICEGNFRPTINCAMHQVFQLPPFCPVCRENSTAWLDSMIQPIYFSSPNAPSFSSGTYSFTVQVDEPTLNTFRYQWWLDNTLVAQNTLAHTVDFNTIDKSQNHLLRFVCTDVDPFIIDTNLRRPWSVEWNLETFDSTLSIGVFDNENAVRLYPNPAKDKLTVVLAKELPALSVGVLSPEGRYVWRNDFVHLKQFELNTSDLTVGIYFMVIRSGNEMKTMRFAVE